MILSLILLFFILVIIIPIPLKIQILYKNNIFKVRIFKYELFSSDIGIKNKYLCKFINKNKLNKNLNTSNSKDSRKKKISFKKLYKNISYKKFRPILKLSGSLNFGIDDAAFCAIIYGLLCNLPFILRVFLSRFFSLKDINLEINPKFNINTISIGITSIFYFNIANIIYIFYLIYISLENKEVNPV